jgi:hypothetical protein
MLFICSGEKIKKLKLYIDDLLIHSIFMVIAKHQADNKDIMRFFPKITGIKLTVFKHFVIRKVTFFTAPVFF